MNDQNDQFAVMINLIFPSAFRKRVLRPYRRLGVGVPYKRLGKPQATGTWEFYASNYWANFAVEYNALQSPG